MSFFKSSFFIAFTGVVGVGLLTSQVWANNDRVQFPTGYENGVRYATVNRGAIREEIFTSPEAIAASKAGLSLPDGTVITMEDHRDGKLYRYIVMEKRAGWGDAYPEEIGAGDWEFREFSPDGTPNLNESGRRCMSCHRSQSDQDFVFTFDAMRTSD